MKLNNADFMTQITDSNHPETLEILINLDSCHIMTFNSRFTVCFHNDILYFHCNVSILGALALKSQLDI